MYNIHGDGQVTAILARTNLVLKVKTIKLSFSFLSLSKFETIEKSKGKFDKDKFHCLEAGGVTRARNSNF